MSEKEPQEKNGESLPVIDAPSLKFQLPEMAEVDIYVLEDEDGNRVVRTAAELEEMGLWPGSEKVKKE